MHVKATPIETWSTRVRLNTLSNATELSHEVDPSYIINVVMIMKVSDHMLRYLLYAVHYSKCLILYMNSFSPL